MAKKSGCSHAFAALGGLLVGELLLAYLMPKAPRLFEHMEAVAGKFGGWVSDELHLRFDGTILVPAVVAGFLAFLWGLLYHRVRHGRSSD